MSNYAHDLPDMSDPGNSPAMMVWAPWFPGTESTSYGCDGPGGIGLKLFSSDPEYEIICCTTQAAAGVDPGQIWSLREIADEFNSVENGSHLVFDCIAGANPDYCD
jgi:hypothetical protein